METFLISLLFDSPESLRIKSVVRNGGQKHWKIFASITQFLTFLWENALLFGECCELRRRRYKLWTLVTITTWFECTFTRMWTRRDYFGDDVLNLGQRLRTSSPRNRRWRPSWRVCRFRCKQKARVAHALRSRRDSHIKSQKNCLKFKMLHLIHNNLYIYNNVKFISLSSLFVSTILSA